MKIGVFGGAFDPPHIAHLILAERAREEFGLDKILFVPTNIPPHKPKPVALAEDRIKLIKIAVKSNRYFEVLDIEIKRGGISYTVDTIRELKKNYPGSQLFLLIGEDEARKFDNWKESDEILRHVRFIIFLRSNLSRSRESNVALLPKEISDFIDLRLEISSTNIRELVRKGKSIKYLVPQKVATYIKEKKLYR